MPLKPEEVLKDLRGGKFLPVYFLQGEEPYYIDLIADYIEQHAIPAAERGFNQTVIYGKDAAMNVILNNARRFPMMAQRQLVIVKEAQEIQDWNSEKAKEMLLAYCRKPLPSTVLVFAYKYKKLDARTSLAKELDKQNVLVETKKLYDNQLPGWIKDYFKQKGFPVSERGALMLSEFIGNDLSRMANEIDKLLINFKEVTEINEDMISRYVGISKEYNTFELQNALARKEVVKANRIVNYFEANPKSNPIIPIIALLFNYFSKILLIHHAPDKSKASIAKLLSVNPFFVDDYMMASRNYPPNKVVSIIGFLRQADLQSKGVDSMAEEGEILKELVFKILHV